ncbi:MULTISPECIES: hypothetical protein [unclassified Streptomyces]|uniref:hypothetical protein n=1 Tax=unclassified Streptomyces TaxID=2593676 RepID=UPI002E1C7F86|nr:hypothetical protein OG282_31325 [Streptomyces sp. NBC_01014]WSX71413.1 hypothetical protein OG221_35065 [Streptomyces sp. NBC_00932]
MATGSANSGHPQYLTSAVAILRLVNNREADFGAYTGPVYFMMHGVHSEERARELAAALHAALYGDLEPLARLAGSRPIRSAS